jgi:hypothetical protein
MGLWTPQQYLNLSKSLRAKAAKVSHPPKRQKLIRLANTALAMAKANLKAGTAVRANLRRKMADLEAWALQESWKIQEREGPPWRKKEKKLLETWRRQRPKMMTDLSEKGAKALAHVLVDRWTKAIDENLRGGMTLLDAMEQAERDWLMMEPESEGDRPMYDRITTSVSPSL